MPNPEDKLNPQTLKALIQAESITELPFSDLIQLFDREVNIPPYLPDNIYCVDPRNNDRIVFNSTRSHRPHDNHPPNKSPHTIKKQPCIICQGKTTGIVDIAPLSTGYTFINKNLYPIMSLENNVDSSSKYYGENIFRAQGLHFLQWTSSIHSKDWHNLPLTDCIIVMERLAALEKVLLDNAQNIPKAATNPTNDRAFVSIIKNCGRLVGGSLTHGHQQILLSNLIPRQILDNWKFKQQHQECFSAFMLRKNPQRLCVRDYGPAVLLVPYFMRRPYDMQLILKDTTKRHLYELNTDEQSAITSGWQDAISLMVDIMPHIGRELAYNVVTHNGPGSGLYFEFLPYTQEMGGYEHLGIYLCQGNPQTVAQNLRECLKNQDSQNFEKG